MRSISTEAKVGVFVLAAMIILGYMSFRVGEYGFGIRKGYPVRVVFDNVAGLERDAAVQIAGVEVGRVESIALEDGRAVVTLRILPSVKLEKDVIASLKTHGILGDKYVDIKPGSGEYGYIPEDGEIDHVEATADMDKMLRELGNIANDVKAVTASLRQVMGGDEGEANLHAIVENTRDLTVNLNRVVEKSDESFSRLAESLTEASHEIQRTFVSLSEISDKINHGEGTIGQLVENRDVFDNLNRSVAALGDITERINRGEGTLGQLVENRELFDNLTSTVESLQKVTAQISSGEGTIGKLVYEDETVDNINRGLKSIDRSMEGINRYVSKTEQFRTYLAYRGEYLARTDKAKSYFTVRIQPREDMFYALGIVADPRGKRTVTERTDYSTGRTVRYEEYDKSGVLFDAQIGKRFRDIVLRGGIFESTGGVGVDYFAFKDALQFTFEAFDFDDERRTHLKAYADYRLFKNVYLTAGWDDFISKHGNSSPFFGLAIRFEDKDLKYMLSNIPLP
ncbi:MAG TPA: MCE family protein [Deltaproteobacteria bacterium]|nr:MCE family protein [Deltaproteobacteria bacterium]